MPWSHTSPTDQRTQFIADYLREWLSITELCELYGVSRKTGYKWIERYIRCGPAGLEEGSRRPQHSPNETAPEMVEALIEVRHRHPSWARRNCCPCCTNAICGGYFPAVPQCATS